MSRSDVAVGTDIVRNGIFELQNLQSSGKVNKRKINGAGESRLNVPADSRETSRGADVRLGLKGDRNRLSNYPTVGCNN
jgi:hypothetical protein